MKTAKFIELTRNNKHNLIILLGILVLFSTSIFACKQRKKGRQGKKANQKEQVIQPSTKEDTSTSLFVIPKPDTTQTKISVNLLYVKSCGVCHQPYPKEKYNATSWGHILDSMQRRAHISDISKANLYHFLTGDTLKLK